MLDEGSSQKDELDASDVGTNLVINVGGSRLECPRNMASCFVAVQCPCRNSIEV